MGASHSSCSIVGMPRDDRELMVGYECGSAGWSLAEDNRPQFMYEEGSKLGRLVRAYTWLH